MNKRTQTILEKYGPDFFRNLGHKGGQSTKDRAVVDPETFKQRGRQGGERTKELYGIEHFQRAARGQKSKKEDASS